MEPGARGPLRIDPPDRQALSAHARDRAKPTETAVSTGSHLKNIKQPPMNANERG